MSIKDFAEKIKPFYVLLLMVVIASIFFALGRLSALEEQKTPIKIENSNITQTASVVQSSVGAQSTETVSSGEVIGSKNSKKYYFPWCGTVKMIKAENQVKFASAEEARSAGYVPGGNCKGLK